MQFAPESAVVNVCRVFAYAKFFMIPPATVPLAIETEAEALFSAPIVFSNVVP